MVIQGGTNQMPRKARARIGSGFAQVQTHVRRLLVNVRKEIGAKEAELSRLRNEESKLSGVFGSRATGRGGAAASRPIGGRKPRINWATVLEQLPKQFKAGDIRKVRELMDKRPSEIFAAITRWTEAGTVKRKERGLYERVQQSQPRSPKKTA
jgi:hypothetical protein